MPASRSLSTGSATVKMPYVFALGAAIAVVLSLPFFGPQWNLLMHIVGAVIFMGNILVTAVWMSLARRSSNTEALRMGARGIMLTDAIFTLPGVILLILNGGIIGTPYFRAHATWLFVSIALFVVSGILWGAVLIPIQRRLYTLMKATPGGASVPAEADQLLRKWFRFGGVAALLPLVTLVLMVLKPGF
jgi:uncharacterized membrane protein